MVILQFGRGAIPQHDSTYGTDYRAYNKLVGPNVTNRRRALIREDGLPHEQIIKHHHGYRNHLITWYDEHYNRRERPACQRFPLLRDYSSNKLAWIPEKTDHPLEGKLRLMCYMCRMNNLTFQGDVQLTACF